MCQGSEGSRARLPGALSLHRRLGSDVEAQGEGSSPRSRWCCAFHAILKMKKHVQARCGTRSSTRPGRPIRQRPHGSFRGACGAWPSGRRCTQRAGGHDGVEEVSPSDRLHSGLGWSAGPPPPMRLIGCSTLKTDCSTPCAMGTAPPTTRLAVRAMALWNFHPYGARLRRDQPSRVSPFHDLNGFHITSWLHNLLIASSMGGLRY